MISGRGLFRRWERMAGPGWTWIEIAACVIPTAIFAALVPINALRQGFGWTPLQHVVAVIIVIEVCGGAVMFNTPQAKLWIHRKGRGFWDLLLFNAAHISPFVVAYLYYPRMNWEYALSVYGVMIVTTIIILKVPLRYKGIAASVIVVAGCRIFEILEAPPPGFIWFEPVYYMKLLLLHSVPPFGLGPQAKKMTELYAD